MKKIIHLLWTVAAVMYLAGMISIAQTGKINPPAWTLGVMCTGAAIALMITSGRKPR